MFGNLPVFQPQTAGALGEFRNAQTQRANLQTNALQQASIQQNMDQRGQQMGQQQIEAFQQAVLAAGQHIERGGTLADLPQQYKQGLILNNEGPQSEADVMRIYQGIKPAKKLVTVNGQRVDETQTGDFRTPQRDPQPAAKLQYLTAMHVDPASKEGKAFLRGGSESAPAIVREFEFFNTLDPEAQKRFIELKRGKDEQKPQLRMVGDKLYRVPPDGNPVVIAEADGNWSAPQQGVTDQQNADYFQVNSKTGEKRWLGVTPLIRTSKTEVRPDGSIAIGETTNANTNRAQGQWQLDIAAADDATELLDEAVALATGSERPPDRTYGMIGNGLEKIAALWKNSGVVGGGAVYDWANPENARRLRRISKQAVAKLMPLITMESKFTKEERAMAEEIAGSMSEDKATDEKVAEGLLFMQDLMKKWRQRRVDYTQQGVTPEVVDPEADALFDETFGTLQ